MTAKAALSLHDREPTAWQGDRRPDPTPQELALFGAAKRFAVLDDRLREHVGPRSGSDYEMLLGDWRSSRSALLDVAASWANAR